MNRHERIELVRRLFGKVDRGFSGCRFWDQMAFEAYDVGDDNGYEDCRMRSSRLFNETLRLEKRICALLNPLGTLTLKRGKATQTMEPIGTLAWVAGRKYFSIKELFQRRGIEIL